MGVSGRLMLKALIEGETAAEKLADQARGSLRLKREALIESLEGRVTEHERWFLGRLLHQVKFIEAEVKEFDERLAALMVEREAELNLLDTIEEVGRRGAENLLSEIGFEMSQFPSAGDLGTCK